jgi:hypothetical protein
MTMDMPTVRVMLTRGGIPLGTQRWTLLSPDTAFRLTALTRDAMSMKSHLDHLLRLTPLRRLHWINFNRHTVEFRTLLRR